MFLNTLSRAMDPTPCNKIQLYRNFGGIFNLLLKGEKVSPKNQPT
jgi:hypothetical protein